MIVTWTDDTGVQHWGAAESKAYRQYCRDNPEGPAEPVRTEEKPERKPEKAAVVTVANPEDPRGK